MVYLTTKEEIILSVINTNSNFKKYVVFVPSSFEGVASASIVQKLLPTFDVAIYYESKMADVYNHPSIDPSKVSYESLVGIIILHIPYKGEAMSDPLYEQVNLPFFDFTHIATFGQEISLSNVKNVSFVVEDCAPIHKLLELISQGKTGMTVSQYSPEFKLMAKAVNDYHIWDWNGNGKTKNHNPLTSMLRYLYEATYTEMPKLIGDKGIMEVTKLYKPLIVGTMKKAEVYINHKVETARTKKDIALSPDLFNSGKEVPLVTITFQFADTYENEISDRLFQLHCDIVNNKGTEVNNTDKIHSGTQRQPHIVLIGKVTKGGDRLVVRTRGISAEKVAKALNNGMGKEEVASVFSPTSYGNIMLNGTIESLT